MVLIQNLRNSQTIAVFSLFSTDELQTHFPTVVVSFFKYFMQDFSFWCQEKCIC